MNRHLATLALAPLAAVLLASCGTSQPRQATTDATPTTEPLATASAATLDTASSQLEAYRVAANNGAGPAVTEMTKREGRMLAAQLCADLVTSGPDLGVDNLYRDAAGRDRTAILLFAQQTVCPDVLDPS